MSKKRKTECISQEELENKIQELAGIIDKVEDEKLEVENRLKKALADYINLEEQINKRAKMKVEQEKLSMAKELIGVMDDSYYALGAGKKMKMDESTSSWMKGLESSVEKLENVMKNFGIERMDVEKGKKFSSSKCEALGTTNEGKENCIYEVIQPGYTMGENIVRPARVIVSKNTK